jgi:hypothetical protein
MTNAIPVPAAKSDAWSSLEHSCASALALSRDIHERLQSGASPTELVPLLQREREAVVDVRDVIAEAVGSPPAGGAQRRDDVARQLSELMEIDDRNRELMSRRGVQLRGPRRGRRSAAPCR